MFLAAAALHTMPGARSRHETNLLGHVHHYQSMSMLMTIDVSAPLLPLPCRKRSGEHDMWAMVTEGRAWL